MNAHPTKHPTDILLEVEERLALVALAVLAFASADEGLRPQEKELNGLWHNLKEAEKQIMHIRESIT